MKEVEWNLKTKKGEEQQCAIQAFEQLASMLLSGLDSPKDPVTGSVYVAMITAVLRFLSGQNPGRLHKASGRWSVIPLTFTAGSPWVARTSVGSLAGLFVDCPSHHRRGWVGMRFIETMDWITELVSQACLDLGTRARVLFHRHATKYSENGGRRPEFVAEC